MTSRPWWRIVVRTIVVGTTGARAGASHRTASVPTFGCHAAGVAPGSHRASYRVATFSGPPAGRAQPAVAAWRAHG